MILKIVAMRHSSHLFDQQHLSSIFSSKIPDPWALGLIRAESQAQRPGSCLFTIDCVCWVDGSELG